ncbi:hypothetical protein NL480_29560, partial [Klebsiella pneumoniae]|nr:hypothetical protein [Klebsiella pneumoniae]
KSLLKQKCSGALDIAIIGLLNHGLNKLKEQNKAIEIKKNKASGNFIQNKKKKFNHFIKDKVNIKKEVIISIGIRMPKNA